jgi:histidinol dehydrogenase
VLVAASRAGVREIYKVGGAQAIAAMAYGTETVPKVAKIFGPGNAWVTSAKTLVSTDPAGAAIDMPAGPSEVLVIADESASPEYVASDLLAQAEHGVDSQVILVTTSIEMGTQVADQIEDQLTRRNT